MSLQGQVIPCNFSSAYKNLSLLRHLFLEPSVDFKLFFPLFSFDEFDEDETFCDKSLLFTVNAAFKEASSRNYSLYCVLPSLSTALKSKWQNCIAKCILQYPTVELIYFSPKDCISSLIKSPNGFNLILTTSLLGEMFAYQVGTFMGSPSQLSTILIGKNAPLFLPLQPFPQENLSLEEISPLGMINAATHLLRFFNLNKEADCVDLAVENVLSSGWRSADMSFSGGTPLAAQELTTLILEQIDTISALMQENFISNL